MTGVAILSSALLEVLDPEQNSNFRDHYLDVAFDLSKVMFIATANLLDTIPAPLRDRMEILELSGYTDDDKLHIAQKYLVPKQLKANGLNADEYAFTDAALMQLIRHYTREAGVRNLEREIGTSARKVATRVAEERDAPKVIDIAEIREYLGRPRYFYEEAVARTAAGGCFDRCRGVGLWRRHHVHRSDADAGQGRAHGDRSAGRRDARVGAGRALAGAVTREGVSGSILTSSRSPISTSTCRRARFRRMVHRRAWRSRRRWSRS